MSVTASAGYQYGARIAAVVGFTCCTFSFCPGSVGDVDGRFAFGVHLVTTAHRAGMSRSCAAAVPELRRRRARSRGGGASERYMDETGFRIGGMTQWLHIASTIWLTFYRVSQKRGQPGRKRPRHCRPRSLEAVLA